MNISKQSFRQAAYLGVLLSIALVISSCSGSSSTNSSTTSTSSEQTEVSNGEPDNVPATSIDAGLIQDEGPSMNTIMSESDSTTGDIPDPVGSNGVPDNVLSTSLDSELNQDEAPVINTTMSESEGATGGIPDPMVQNNTVVTFEITVPAYQSNQLQLLLNWGEFSTSINWIGDEFWSVDANLPTDTEQLLSIIFFDENGDIELGSFEQQYRTGINAAEVFQVTADQFDTDRWDFDNDGASNLEELIAGDDPRVDEDSLLDIEENQQMSLLFIANYFETLLPNDRPYMATFTESVTESEVMSTTADIDANGNGTMFIDTPPFARFNLRRGERLVQDNSVRWSGSWNYRDDFSLNQNFTSEVSVDGESRRLVEEGSGSWIGTYTHRWETTVDVTGQLIEGSSFCEVASGTITESYTTNQDGRRTITLTITRDSVDDFWRVSRVSEFEFGTSNREYFARELSMHLIRFGYQQPVSENDYFFCDFVDL